MLTKFYSEQKVNLSLNLMYLRQTKMFKNTKCVAVERARHHLARPRNACEGLTCGDTKTETTSAAARIVDHQIA